MSYDLWDEAPEDAVPLGVTLDAEDALGVSDLIVAAAEAQKAGDSQAVAAAMAAHEEARAAAYRRAEDAYASGPDALAELERAAAARRGPPRPRRVWARRPGRVRRRPLIARRRSHAPRRPRARAAARRGATRAGPDDDPDPPSPDVARGRASGAHPDGLAPLAGSRTAGGHGDREEAAR